MKKWKSNALLVAAIAVGGGAVLFGTQPAPAKATSGYTPYVQNLVGNRENCNAMCGQTRFSGTTWMSGRTVYARMTGDLLSNGGTAHLRAHAGCGSITSHYIGSYSSKDETVSTGCPSGTSVKAHDCNLELLSNCSN